MLLGKEAASGTAVSARVRYNRFAARFLGLEKDENPWLNSDKELIYLSTVS